MILVDVDNERITLLVLSLISFLVLFLFCSVKIMTITHEDIVLTNDDFIYLDGGRKDNHNDDLKFVV